MIRSVLYSESWLPWSVGLKKWPVRKFMEPLKFITWLLIVNNKYCQRRKALALLSAPPFLRSDYITFEVGQWTQFLLWSFFICNSQEKSERLEDTHWKVSYPHQSRPSLKGAARLPSHHWAAETFLNSMAPGKSGLQEGLLSRETNKSIALEKTGMIFFFFLFETCLCNSSSCSGTITCRPGWL